MSRKRKRIVVASAPKEITDVQIKTDSGVQDSRCIVCHGSFANDDEVSDLSPVVTPIKLVSALAKALKLSDFTYRNFELVALPTTPFCSDCKFLIYDAIRILKEIKRLENHWESVAGELKSIFIGSYKPVLSKSQHSQLQDYGSHTSKSNVNLIREALMKCLTKGNTKVTSESSAGGKNLIQSSERVKSVSPADELEEISDFNDLIQIENNQREEFEIATGENTLTADVDEFILGDMSFQSDDIVFEDHSEDFHNVGNADIEPDQTVEDDEKNVQGNETSNNVDSTGTNVNGGSTHGNTRTSKVFQCKYCQKLYRKRYFLEAHEQVHRGNLSFECHKCDRNFVSLRSLRLHLAIHHHLRNEIQPKRPKKKDYIMKITHTASSSRTVFKRSLTSFQCRQCMKEFVKEDFTTPAGVCEVKCEIPKCGKIFENFSIFRRHHELTCPDRPVMEFECDFCGKKCSSRSNLAAHKTSFHTKEFKYFCEICELGILTPSLLRKHMLTHTNEKPFKCDLCSKSFKRNAQFTCHMRRHRNEFPYLCETCGKKFVSLQLLQAHETIHLDEKKYPCHLCKKLFMSKNYVRNHIYSFHRKRRKPR